MAGSWAQTGLCISLALVGVARELAKAHAESSHRYLRYASQESGVIRPDSMSRRRLNFCIFPDAVRG